MSSFLPSIEIVVLHFLFCGFYNFVQHHLKVSHWWMLLTSHIGKLLDMQTQKQTFDGKWIENGKKIQ